MIDIIDPHDSAANWIITSQPPAPPDGWMPKPTEEEKRYIRMAINAIEDWIRFLPEPFKSAHAAIAYLEGLLV